jgi:hypothetical protein
MFLDNENIEKAHLRQGDIISKIHILGALNLNGIHYSAIAGQPDKYTSWGVQAIPKFSDAIILSHNCEIDIENRIKLTGIILAPLRDVHKATDEKRKNELIESNLIDQSEPKASFLKYFYIRPNSDLEYKDGAIADFSKCFSVRKNSYQSLLENKVTQLTPEATNSMALKLALYFHRQFLDAA